MQGIRTHTYTFHVLPSFQSLSSSLLPLPSSGCTSYTPWDQGNVHTATTATNATTPPTSALPAIYAAVCSTKYLAVQSKDDDISGNNHNHHVSAISSLICHLCNDRKFPNVEALFQHKIAKHTSEPLSKSCNGYSTSISNGKDRVEADISSAGELGGVDANAVVNTREKNLVESDHDRNGCDVADDDSAYQPLQHHVDEMVVEDQDEVNKEVQEVSDGIPGVETTCSICGAQTRDGILHLSKLKPKTLAHVPKKKACDEVGGMGGVTSNWLGMTGEGPTKGIDDMVLKCSKCHKDFLSKRALSQHCRFCFILR